MDTKTRLRPLHEIAYEALSCDSLTGNARKYASSYLSPMLSMESTRDTYFADSGDSIVAYALCNLTQWRGPVARRIKLELNAHLKAHR